MSLAFAWFLQAAQMDAPPPRLSGPEGAVVLVCSVTARGKMVDCLVDSEEPAGQGFGAAALEMSKEFKLKARGPGASTMGGGTIRIPIKFKLPAPPERTPALR